MSDYDKSAVNPSKNTEQQPPSRDDAFGAEEALRRREAAISAREESIGQREDAIAIVEEALRAKVQAEQLNAQLREANERLIVATVEAQTAEEHADHANRLKDDFLATVSHELRTPLNAVLGWARLLKAKQLTADRAGHAVETIERNAVSLGHIIDDLLDVSRIIAGTLHLTTEPIDLIIVAQVGIEVIRPLAASKQIDVRFSPEPGATARVNGDGVRLQQVIWNLLANAVKFTPNGGRVDVSVERAGVNIEVNIVDTGQGIDPEFLPHVFERFRQADGAPSRRQGGLGLGLAIVRQLVELHAGTVHAASAGVGRGSTFTVRLPALAAGAQVEKAPALVDRRSGESKEPPTSRLPRLDDLRILLVDDDDDGRALATLVLTQAHASVKAVGSVREARELLAMEWPDVLVSDIGLPDEDGYSLIRKIRRDEADHGGFLPAIALTGYARAEDKIRALVAGFQAHVVKPLEPAELMATIADLTGHARFR
jgi:signal transduction histidine kinase/ActR/RegA family two-component response regulator